MGELITAILIIPTIIGAGIMLYIKSTLDN